MAEQLRLLTDAASSEPVGLALPATYRFRHALMRDAAYETQVLDVRRARTPRWRRCSRRTARSRP